MIMETAAGRISLERVGDGPDLVLLHSLLGDRNVFAPVVPFLAQTHRVNLVDLPGFGDTTPAAASIEAYGDAVGGLLDEGGFLPGTTDIIGNGLGAFVALAAAIRYGDRFHKLVLVGCGAVFPEAGKSGFHAMIEKVRGGGMESIVEIALRRIFPESYLAAHPVQAEERRAVLRRTDPEAFVTACQALLALDYRGEAAGITNPTCLVAGELDQATPPAMAADLAGWIPGARLHVLAGLAHAPQLQDPKVFLEVVGPFLEAFV